MEVQCIGLETESIPTQDFRSFRYQRSGNCSGKYNRLPETEKRIEGRHCDRPLGKFQELAEGFNRGLLVVLDVENRV